jgi:hypothetical protein
VVKAMVPGEELLGVGVEHGGASHPWCGGAGHAQWVAEPGWPRVEVRRAGLATGQAGPHTGAVDWAQVRRQRRRAAPEGVAAARGIRSWRAWQPVEEPGGWRGA